jgi:hypothetical protein
VFSRHPVNKVIKGRQNDPSSEWHCVVQPQFFLAHVGGTLSSIAGFVLSIDRFIVVQYPEKYSNMDTGYVHKILGAAALYGFCSWALMLASVYFDANAAIRPHLRTCAGQIFPEWYSLYLYAFVCILNCLGVAIYCAVFVSFRRAVARVYANVSPNDLRDAQDRRLTVTLGIISISTFLCYTLPNLIFGITAVLDIPLPLLATQILATIVRMGTIIHFTIYVARQHEVRTAMLRVLKPRLQCTCVYDQQNTLPAN